MQNAVEVSALSHIYGKGSDSTLALNDVSFSVKQGEIFGLLGPNGGGKSTMFKILSTAMVPARGTVKMLGADLLLSPMEVRRNLGVVFQSPALDKKLTVDENLTAQGHLYGISGRLLSERIEAVSARLGLIDRKKQRVDKLSGGLQRRVEIAKAMLHDPKIFILDEPTTGLDPLMRKEIWDHLRYLRQSTGGKTILATTHLLEEAEWCDRIGILHRGKMVALGTPSELKSELGGDVIAIRARDPETLKVALESNFQSPIQILDGEIRMEKKEGHEWISPVISKFGDQIESIQLRKPTLEDLFIRKTGERMFEKVSS